MSCPSSSISGASVDSPAMQFVPETEEQSALRKLAREVADRELAPRAAHWDETEEFPHDSWRAIAEAGLFGVTVGEEFGGAGLPRLRGKILLPGPAPRDRFSADLLPRLLHRR